MYMDIHGISFSQGTYESTCSITEIVPDNDGENIEMIKTVYWDGSMKRTTTVGNMRRVNEAVIGEGSLSNRIGTAVFNMSRSEKMLCIRLWDSLSSENVNGDLDEAASTIFVILLCSSVGHLYYLTRDGHDVGEPFKPIDFKMDFDSEGIPVCKELFRALSKFPVFPVSNLLQGISKQIRVGITWLRVFNVSYTSIGSYLIENTETKYDDVGYPSKPKVSVWDECKEVAMVSASGWYGFQLSVLSTVLERFEERREDMLLFIESGGVIGRGRVVRDVRGDNGEMNRDIDARSVVEEMIQENVTVETPDNQLERTSLSIYEDESD